jgi:hypothetical protein
LRDLGAPIEGICLFATTAYPGWDNSRHAEVGLFSVIQAEGGDTSANPQQMNCQQAFVANTTP